MPVRRPSFSFLNPAANLKIYLHCFVLDGLYGVNSENAPVFQHTRAPLLQWPKGVAYCPSACCAHAGDPHPTAEACGS